MIFYQIKAGGDRNFAYLAADGDGGGAVLFDPPRDAGRYVDLLDKHDLTVEYVVFTHGHSDHTWGGGDVTRRFLCKTVGHESTAVNVDLRVKDGDAIRLGGITLEFIHTPGHTEDSICILCGGKLVTGDTLFVGKVGGTDFGDGARKEYDSIHQKLMKLDPAIEVYPGHDYGTSPTSTIGEELESNPFILRDSFETFLDLKKNWLQYKAEHGID